MKKILFFNLAAVFLLLVTSCDKYEDGPSFSLLTKKMRLTGDWEMIQITYNGSDITNITPDITLKIDKDDSFTMTATSGNSSSSTYGTWTFNNDKTELILTDNDQNSEIYTILELRNDKLKLKQTDNLGYDTVISFEQ